MNLPPNAAGRWVHCPGSVRLSKACAIPSNDRDAADEGILAHAVAAEYLRSGVLKAGATTTEEMIEGAQMYFEDVKSVVGTSGAHVIVEGHAVAVTIHTENAGIIDCYAYDRVNDILYIWEYKFGFTLIDPYEDWQLIDYAAAALSTVNATQATRVVLTVVQPRGFHRDGPIRRWETTYIELLPYFEQLSDAANEAQRDDARCIPGPHCHRCKASHGCEALQRADLNIVDIAYTSAPLILPDEAVGRELAMLQRAMKFIKARVEGLELDVTHRIRDHGKRIAGFELQAGRGKDVWIGSVEEVAAMGSMMGVEVLKAPALMTPKQCVAAGLPVEVIEPFFETHSGALTLKPDSGKLIRIFK